MQAGRNELELGLVPLIRVFDQGMLSSGAGWGQALAVGPFMTFLSRPEAVSRTLNLNFRPDPRHIVTAHKYLLNE